MEHGSNGIEQIKALEAAVLKGLAVINGDQKLASHYGHEETKFSAQSQAHEQQGDPLQSKSEKEKQYAIAVAQVSVEIMASHNHLMANGFNDYSDVKKFGGMLDDAEYREFLMSDAGAEDRKKIENQLTQNVLSGKMTMEQMESSALEGAKTPEAKECVEGICSRVRQNLKEAGKEKNAIDEIKENAAGLISDKSAQKIGEESQELSKISKGSERAHADEEQTFDNRRQAIRGGEKETYQNAEKKGTITGREEQENTMSDLIAGVLEENKDSISVLQNAQKQAEGKAESKATDVQLASNNQSKGGMELG